MSDIPVGSNLPPDLVCIGGAGQRSISWKQGDVTVPPWESLARAVKTKANKRMHELQRPLGVHAIIAADQVSGEGVTPPAAVAKFARASSFATTTTTVAREIQEHLFL
jgi:hypothetical protein